MPDPSRYTEEELDAFDAVRERDVDLAVVLALRASITVRALFTDQVGISSAPLLSAGNSLTTSDGREADIVLRVGDADEPTVIEIENKINAVFQAGQAKSYAQRAEERREEAVPGEGYAILLAPDAYLDSHPGKRAFFDGTVSYEALQEGLRTEGEWGRSVALLLEHAILQHRRGGAESPDSPERTAFFRAFAELGEEYGLPPVPPKPRKGAAGFLWYPRRGTLSPLRESQLENGVQGVWLGAKLTNGHADIELTGVRPLVDVARIQSEVEEVEGLRVVAKDKSVRFRRDVPVLDPDRPLDEQLAEARVFVESLVRLRDWWERDGRNFIEQELS